jgi:hypothetical protein
MLGYLAGMIGLLSLLAAIQAPPTPLSPRPEAAEVHDDRRAMDAAIANRLLGSGYFQMVDDPGERSEVAARFQQRLRAIGIPATVGRCHWIGLVSTGTASGNRSHGGACRVGIGSQPPADLLICEADLGAVTLVDPDWFAFDAAFVELFIRRTCL